MKLFTSFLTLLSLGASSVAALDLSSRQDSQSFVAVKNGQFSLNNKEFFFYGTNAYWVPLTTDIDMDSTFRDIAVAGFNVVRTWAFNDVLFNEPAGGTYFQIINRNGSVINEDSNGLKRLDQAVATAEKYGIRLLLTLTNNWNPERPTPSAGWSRRQESEGFPRGYLSNDYGGMDAYVRAFHPSGSQTHDLFYTDRDIIGAFKNYVAHIVQRYASSPAVLGWELANDLRCASTLPASPSCNTKTITNWVTDISSFIKSIDPNHIITAGDGGFYCLKCPKLFAKDVTPPSPSLIGSAFDGSYGVDTEDILAAPSIDFGSFQLFPDQIEYFPFTFDEFATKSISEGGRWVVVHANTAERIGKPAALTAMSIISRDSFSAFVPFGSTAPAPEGTPCGGVEGFQVDYAFTSWASTALHNGIGGILEYQWQQDGLTSQGTLNENWISKRALTSSPTDGSARYAGTASKQNAKQQSKRFGKAG